MQQSDLLWVTAIKCRPVLEHACTSMCSLVLLEDNTPAGKLHALDHTLYEPKSIYAVHMVLNVSSVC